MHNQYDQRARLLRVLPRASLALLTCSLPFASLGMLSGCRSYERRPIDLSAHREAFLAGATLPDAAVEHLATEDGAPLGIAAAEELALLLNPDLRLARWHAGVVRASADNAGLWDDPAIGLDLSKLLEGPSQGWEVLGSVGFTVPMSGRLSLERDVATALTDVERARLAADEWATRGAVREAYFTWCAAHAACAEERAFSARLARILTLVETLAARGELARVEARLFNIEEIEAEGKLAELEAAVMRARVALLRIIGLAPTASVAFDPLGLEVESVAFTPTDGDQHPAILWKRAEYEAAERALELEVRKQYPDLEIGPGYGEQDGDRQFVLGLGIALPILNANRQGIAEAEASREAARVAAEIAVESLAFDRTEAEIALALAKTRRQSLVDGVLPLVDAQAEDMRRLADLGGEVDALILLDSLKRGREVRLALVSATRELRIAESRVTTLHGAPSNNLSASDGRMELKP